MQLPKASGMSATDGPNLGLICGSTEGTTMVNAVEAFDAKHMKPAEEIPAFRPGDTVDVNVKIQEGNNSRIQTFTGVVIARKGAGVRETFIVRKISFGTGVERRFPLHSPSIDSIKLVRKGRVRRAHSMTSAAISYPRFPRSGMRIAVCMMPVPAW